MLFLNFCLLQSRDNQGLIPVTVKQISEASHSGDDKSNFQIDGVDVTNVYSKSLSSLTLTPFALVENIFEKSFNHSFIMEK